MSQKRYEIRKVEAEKIMDRWMKRLEGKRGGSKEVGRRPNKEDAKTREHKSEKHRMNLSGS